MNAEFATRSVTFNYVLIFFSHNDTVNILTYFLINISQTYIKDRNRSYMPINKWINDIKIIVKIKIGDSI